MMVMALARKLPQGYAAEPRVHLGTFYEIDVASYEVDVPAGEALEATAEEGGIATAVWAPPEPTLVVATDVPDQYAYEVLV